MLRAEMLKHRLIEAITRKSNNEWTKWRSNKIRKSNLPTKLDQMKLMSVIIRQLRSTPKLREKLRKMDLSRN